MKLIDHFGQIFSTRKGFSEFSKVQFIIIFISLSLPYLAQTQIINNNLPELQNIDVEEHLGEYIPLNLFFINDQGNKVELSNYFNQGKPVILVMAYYNCPMLCTLVLNGITQSVYNMGLELGEDYNMITVSIDPRETAELASAKKKTHMKMLNKPEIDEGWTFFVGEDENIKKLADAVGFKYYYVEDREEFAHPAVVMLLTEDGKISRYLYGIEYKPMDVKLGLLEAAQGRIGSTIDRLILYCYHYDPNSKGYVVFAGNVMKIGGAITLVIMAIFLGLMWVRESRKKSLSFSNN